MNKEFLFVTFDHNKEFKFASYYPSLDDVFLAHRFKVPLDILKRNGYAKNTSNDGSGCFLVYLDYKDDLVSVTETDDGMTGEHLDKIFKCAVREVKLKELGI